MEWGKMRCLQNKLWHWKNGFIIYIRERNGEIPKEESLEDWPCKLKSVHIELGRLSLSCRVWTTLQFGHSLSLCSLFPFHITKREAIIIWWISVKSFIKAQDAFWNFTCLTSRQVVISLPLAIWVNFKMFTLCGPCCQLLALCKVYMIIS